MKRSVIVCLGCLCAAAQSRPGFEVASVKASGVGPYRVIGRVDADGINFTNMTLRLCIQRAFGIKPYQLIGPDWIDTERFVIMAKASAPAPQEKLMEMLQTLLAERFKLAFHRETKEIPVYALVVGKSGSKLKEATDEGLSNVEVGDNGELIFSRVTMDTLSGVLAASVDRPVLDETGLKGKYNFALAWSERRRKDGSMESASPDAPSMFTAVQESLGLKLEPSRAPVEMFVIDHVERPTEN